MMHDSYVHQQQKGKAPIQEAVPMSADIELIDNRQQVLLTDRHLQVRRTCTHKTSIVLSFITCGAALNIALGQVFAMVMQTVSWLELVVRIYEILWSIFIVLNECQCPNVIQESPIVQSYTWRGVLYSFVGILGVLMNDIGMNGYIQKNLNNYGSYSDSSVTIYIPTQEQALEWYIRVVSWSMVGFGVIYFVLGLLRQKQKVDRHREEYAMRLSDLGQDNDRTACLCGVMA